MTERYRQPTLIEKIGMPKLLSFAIPLALALTITCCRQDTIQTLSTEELEEITTEEANDLVCAAKEAIFAEDWGLPNDTNLLDACTFNGSSRKPILQCDINDGAISDLRRKMIVTINKSNHYSQKLPNLKKAARVARSFLISKLSPGYKPKLTIERTPDHPNLLELHRDAYNGRGATIKTTPINLNGKECWSKIDGSYYEHFGQDN